MQRNICMPLFYVYIDYKFYLQNNISSDSLGCKQIKTLPLHSSFGVSSEHASREMKRESGVNPEQTRCCKLI